LADNYFSIDEEKIKQIETVLTKVNGKEVYAKYEFQSFAPLPLKTTPAWSPISIFRGYYNSRSNNVNDNTDNPSHQQEQINFPFSFYIVYYKLFSKYSNKLPN
jgi:hypothetical protein